MSHRNERWIKSSKYSVRMASVSARAK
jgi:hypothetical protein